MRGFGVVGEHAHTVFNQPVELVEQVSVNADTSGHSKKPECRKVIEIPIVNPTRGNSPRSSRKQRLRCPCRSQRKPEIMRHGVGGTKRYDAQCGIFAGKALEHIVDGAVATASDNGVEPLANRSEEHTSELQSQS